MTEMDGQGMLKITLIILGGLALIVFLSGAQSPSRPSWLVFNGEYISFR